MTKSANLFERYQHWWLGWLPFWVYTAFVFQGAVLAPEDIPQVFIWLNDKLIHGIEYFFLYILSVNALQRSRSGWFHSRAFYLSFLWCFLIGLLTEWAQFYVPGRSMDLEDWFADFAGALAGFFYLALVPGWILRREKGEPVS